MSRGIDITRLAEFDLEEIWDWTADQFGEDQADGYISNLEGAMLRCAEAPEIGRRRDDLRDGYRCIVSGKHIIFYTVSKTHVVIQRVLHGAMDPDSHLPGH